MKVIIPTLALVVAFALPAEAQLKLQMSNGRVTLDAVNVPARQILSEWARIGGTRIVGGEKVVGPPLTLKLVDMPERQALDIILRNVAGFMAAPRLASAAPGASSYDRILIMATSSAPAPTANANVNGRPGVGAPGMGNTMNGTPRRVPLRPPNLPPSVGDEPADVDNPAVEDDQADNGTETPVFTFPAPGQVQPGGNTPVFMPMPNNGQPGTAPVITLQPGQNGPTIYNFVPTEGQPGTTPPPSTMPNAFGVVGSPTPGMIQVPASPTNPTQPTQTQPTRPNTRPPGE
jgi:hypothetical protein